MSEKHHKTATEEYIDKAAEAGARKVLQLQHKSAITNHYRATERLLRMYRYYKQLEEHPEEYGFFPTGKSHDISVAPPPGTGVSDKIEINELFVESRKRSFIRTMERLTDLKTVIKLFENKKEFVVIRLYYFNEDINGNDRGDNAKHYTWEEIAEEMDKLGIERSVSMIRRWRSKLVQDMAVALFGIDGALSIESREPNHEANGKGGKANEQS